MIRLRQLADLLIEDHVADGGDDDVARLFVQQGVDPRVPVDPLGRRRRVDPPVLDRKSGIPGEPPARVRGVSTGAAVRGGAPAPPSAQGQRRSSGNTRQSDHRPPSVR